MKEINANIFDLIADPAFGAICINTNGALTANNESVMGAGNAGEAAKRWPSIRKINGEMIFKYDNRPMPIGLIDYNGEYHEPRLNSLLKMDYKCVILSFPTKHNWKGKADLKLIERSAFDLVKIADKMFLSKIAIGAPGCGQKTGQLDWEKEVKPILQDILTDDRFNICFWSEK